MTDDPEITDPRDPYKPRDIVGELDRWLVSRASFREATVSHALLRAAREEIMALRASLERHDRLVIQAVVVATPSIRDDALEEAARACERRRDETGPQEAYAVLDVQSYTSACGGCAYDIRALKGKRDE